MSISFKVNHTITTDQFLGLLENSTLGERRTIHTESVWRGGFQLQSRRKRMEW